MPDDAAVLTALAKRAKACWGYPPEWLDAWQENLTITPAYIRQHHVLVACVDGVPVGVCAIEDHGQRWELAHVWVDPPFHRRGIGQTLVRQALAFVRETRPGIVEVASDPYAAEFYRRLGAQHSGTMPAPMPDAPERGLPLFEFQVVAA
jgi:GNAT superfamily N-acetyltransferase